MEISYLMLGGNVGNRMEYLCRSVDLLRRNAGRITAMSAVYESEPWGFEDPCQFLNQVVVLETNLDPYALLENIKRIEQTLGRLRTSKHNGYQSRTIDIDILFYGDLVINTHDLVIPHQRITERMFVLQPMSELAPDMEHPVLHRTIAHLKEHCTDNAQIRPYLGAAHKFLRNTLLWVVADSNRRPLPCQGNALNQLS